MTNLLSTDMYDSTADFVFYAREAFELMKLIPLDISTLYNLLLNAALSLIEESVDAVELDDETVYNYVFMARGIAEHLREEVSLDGGRRITTQEDA